MSEQQARLCNVGLQVPGRGSGNQRSICNEQGGWESREIHLNGCLRGRPQVGSKEIAAVGKAKGK